MKTTHTLRNLLLLTGSSLLAISSASAQSTFYWDGGTVDIGTDGNGVSGGTTGNWNASLTNWDQGAGLAHIAWDNTNTLLNPADTAVFGGTAGTVTIGAGGITTGGLTFFSNSGYTITAGSNGLNFGAANNTINHINVSGTTSSATISGTVSSVSGGNLIFNSNNPFVTSTLTFTGTSAGGWSGSTTINSNTTLVLGATTNASTTASKVLADTSAITLNGGGITINYASGYTAGRINTAPIAVNGGGTFTIGTSAGSLTEDIGAVTLNSGQLNFQYVNNPSSGGFINLASLTRSSTTSAVTFSGNFTGGSNFRVGGVSNTAAGEIIGPWATTGGQSGIAAQTDYAIYTSGDGTVRAAGIAATAENTWASGANVTLSGATSLTGTRTLNSLRYTGAAGTLDLGSNNLETYGLLNGGSGLLTVSGAGALTTASGGGNLFLTTGSTTNNIAVSASINNNDGAVALVKGGAGTLTLSGTNGYTGGTVINSGTLSIGSANNIGGSGADLTFGGTGTLTATGTLSGLDTLTVNQGAVGTFLLNTASTNVNFATTTGSGTLVASTGLNSTYIDLGDASGFTGTLQGRLTGNANIAGSANAQIRFSDIADTVGSAIQIGGGTSDGGQGFRVRLKGDAGPLVFDNREIQILSRVASNWTVRRSILENYNTNAANTWVINTDLAHLTDQTLTFELDGTNTGNNAFNGLISNGNLGGTISLQKSGSGKWIVSNNNTFTGSVTAAGGTLVLSGTNQYTGATVVTSSGTLSVNSVSDYGVASAIGKAASGAIILGTSTAGTLEYTGSGHSSNRQFQIGPISQASGNGTILNNGTGALIFDAPIFNTNDPTTGGSAGSRNLTLGGDYTGEVNEIQGAILANTGAPTLRDIAIIKTGASSWKLSGDNTYTKTTSVQAGNLIAGNNSPNGASGAFGNASSEISLGVAGGNDDAGLLIGGAYNVGRDIRLLSSNTTDGGSRVLTLGGNTAHNSEFSGNIFLGSTNFAGRGVTLTAAENGQVTFSGAIQNPTSMDATTYTVTKSGLGTVILATTNSYTGTTTVTDGTLLITGSTSASSAVTVSGGAIGGTGSILSTLSLSAGSFHVVDLFDALQVAGTVSIYAGFGVDNLVGLDWSTVDAGTYTLIDGDLGLDVFANLNHNSSGNFYDAGFGRTAYFQEGSLQLVVDVIPEPSVALLGGLGLLALFRRRRA